MEVFAEIDKFENSSLIVGGDFNAVIGPLDYQGTRQRHSNSKVSDMLSVIIDEYNLVDVWRNFHPTLRQYTRHQKSPRVLSRLDFILVSSNFLNNCVKSKILPGIQSDHSIVTVQFNDNQPLRGKGYWKLNCHYLHHDTDFINLIKEKIEEFKQIHNESDCNPNTLWDSLKCFIIGIIIEYTARKKKEKKKEKDQLLSEIDKIKFQLSNDASSNNSHVLKLEELEDKLNKLYDFETKGLIIRSRVRWLEEGEKNSKYFCNLENRSWQKKTISSLQDAEGNITSDPDKILKEIHSFYSKLYSNLDSVQDLANDDVNKALFDNIDIPKLNEDEQLFLENPLSKQEIFDVIKSMKINKTPGFDGLPIEFYVVLWPDICDMLMNSFNFSLQNGMMSVSQRNGVITLLPKKDKDHLLIKNYPGAIVLLDIEKAFDSVNHNFLFHTLKQFNFGTKFIDWIRTLYSARQIFN